VPHFGAVTMRAGSKGIWLRIPLALGLAHIRGTLAFSAVLLVAERPGTRCEL
jgi:hypothetical protein